VNEVLGRQDSDAFREQFQESFGSEMSALKDFRDAISEHMKGFHQELETHAKDNRKSIQMLVEGQERNDKNLQILHDDQLRSETIVQGIKETMDKMERNQADNSGEIRELRAESNMSKTERNELYNKVGVLEVRAGSKTSVPPPGGLMSSKYFHGAIGIAVILIVIGFFRYIGDIDVASDASNLIKPSAVIPR
jgi:hypothetical protein